MQLELDGRKFITADVEDAKEHRADREQILSEPWRLSVEPVLDDSNDPPEALEPEPMPSTYFPRPVFGDWDEERPSDGEVRPSYADLIEDDESLK